VSYCGNLMGFFFVFFFGILGSIQLVEFPYNNFGVGFKI
jgi:hypothetical protein